MVQKKPLGSLVAANPLKWLISCSSATALIRLFNAILQNIFQKTKELSIKNNIIIFVYNKIKSKTMAIITLTLLDSGSTFDIDERNIIRVSNRDVDGTDEGYVEYHDESDGLKKSVIIDEDVTAVTALAAHLIPVTLFPSSEVVLIASSKVSTVEDLVSNYDGTTTVGTLIYDTKGSQSRAIEVTALKAVLKPLLNAAVVL